MALALERRFEPFSQGRGFISPERVAEIEKIAARHGIFLAPLYNADGAVEASAPAVRSVVACSPEQAVRFEVGL
jgi:hypothetical protein